MNLSTREKKFVEYLNRNLRHDAGLSIYTEQMVNRKEKREVVKWIESELNPLENQEEAANKEKQSQTLFNVQKMPLK